MNPAKTDTPYPWISEGLRNLATPIGQLHPDPDNVRTHDERNLDAILASLERFGQQAPVVYVRRQGKKIVVKGNGLLAAAKALGWSHLAAAKSGLKGHDLRAYAIADNRTTDLSTFDADLLAAQLQELDDADYDLEATGFDDDELEELLDAVEAETTAGGDDDDDNETKARHRRVSQLFSVIVECEDESDQLAFYTRMKKEGRRCKLYVL